MGDVHQPVLHLGLLQMLALRASNCKFEFTLRMCGVREFPLLCEKLKKWNARQRDAVVRLQYGSTFATKISHLFEGAGRSKVELIRFYQVLSV